MITIYSMMKVVRLSGATSGNTETPDTPLIPTTHSPDSTVLPDLRPSHLHCTALGFRQT